jgi:type VI protein secretion system component VasF
MSNQVQVRDALLQATGKTLDELWNDWTETLSRRSGFAAAVRLISRRGLPLFGIIAVLVVLGYLRYLLVKRRKMKRWEEEERMGYW